VDGQRERKQRLVKVGEHHVLRTNMYDLDKVTSVNSEARSP
jgi:hypothetical protein